MPSNLSLHSLLLCFTGVGLVLLGWMQTQFLPFYGAAWAFVTIILMELFLWAVYLTFVYPNYISPIRNLPCLGTLRLYVTIKGAHPVFGHTGMIMSDSCGEDLLRSCLQTPNNGLIRLKGLFSSDQVLITSPKALAHVLVTAPYNFPKPERGRSFLRAGLGDGLVVAEGSCHKFQRKHCMPSFTFRNIKQRYPLFWDKSVKMTKLIDNEVFGYRSTSPDTRDQQFDVVDIDEWAQKTTLDIIGIAGLGRDFDILHHSNDELALHYKGIFTPFRGTQMVAASLLILGGTLTKLLVPLVMPFASARAFRALSGIRVLSREFVREKKKLQVHKQATGNFDTLASLIESNAFSDHELADQLLTLVAAGHETTSSAFTWIIYYLTLYPDLQLRLRAEVQAALPDSISTDSSSLDLAAILESLPLLNGICNEILRILPPIATTMRQSKHNTNHIGQPIPAGTVLTMAPCVINRHPDLWGSDAHEFKPERWIDKDTGKPNQKGGVSTNYAFLTFLHGPRSCIGQNFARAELRSLLAAFVATYQWTMADPNEKITPAIVVTAKLKNRLKVKLVKVERC
ncbi:cytochrome P450 [Aspergillus spinulosporus]